MTNKSAILTFFSTLLIFVLGTDAENPQIYDYLSGFGKRPAELEDQYGFLGLGKRSAPVYTSLGEVLKRSSMWRNPYYHFRKYMRNGKRSQLPAYLMDSGIGKRYKFEDLMGASLGKRGFQQFMGASLGKRPSDQEEEEKPRIFSYFGKRNSDANPGKYAYFGKRANEQPRSAVDLSQASPWFQGFAKRRMTLLRKKRGLSDIKEPVRWAIGK